MSPFREPPEDLEERVDSLLSLIATHPNDLALQERAAALAYEIRSRCIDLATWKAEYSPEYKQRETQARALLQVAREQASEAVFKEFGVQPPNNSLKPNPLRGSA